MPAALIFHHVVDTIRYVQDNTPNILAEQDFLAIKPWYNGQKYNDYVFKCWLDHFENKFQALDYAAKSMEIHLDLKYRQAMRHFIETSQNFLKAMQEIQHYSSERRYGLYVLPDISWAMHSQESIAAECLEVMRDFNQLMAIPQQQMLAIPFVVSDMDNRYHAFKNRVEQLSQQLEPGLGSKLLGTVTAFCGSIAAMTGMALTVAGMMVLTNPVAILTMTTGMAALCLLIGVPCCIIGFIQADHGYKFFSGWHSQKLNQVTSELAQPDCLQAITNTRSQLQIVHQRVLNQRMWR